MGVPVAERRHQEAAAEVDLVGARRRRPGFVADRTHHSVDDEQRIGLRTEPVQITPPVKIVAVTSGTLRREAFSAGSFDDGRRGVACAVGPRRVDRSGQRGVAVGPAGQQEREQLEPVAPLIQIEVGDQHGLLVARRRTSTRPYGSEMNDEP